MRMTWTALALAMFLAGCKGESPSRPTTQAGARADGLAAEGAPAPAVEAVAHTGEKGRLTALHGQPIVLYFYPKDDTPGCTKEACELRDAYAEIKGVGAVVLGVSAQG